MTTATGRVTSTGSRTAWSSRGWAIYLGWTVITLDGSALNLALPSIADELHAPASGVSWVVDAYTLPLASLLLLAGGLGDRVGAERLFRTGALGFAAASAACALSPSIAALVTSRALQGVFAALLLPMVLALVGKSFGDPRQRAAAVNLVTVFGAAGLGLGPFLGGLLTDTTGWRAVFWLTVPLAVAAALLVGGRRASGARQRGGRVDVVGQVTGTAGLVVLVAGLIETGHAASTALGPALLALGALLLTCFVLVEHRSPAPLLPLAAFRVPGFPGVVLGGFALQLGAYGLQFFLAVHLQTSWGVSALTGGLLLVSYAVGMLLVSVTVSPPLLRRGPRSAVVVGAVTAAAGTAALLAADRPGRWWLVVVAQLVVGAGTGVYTTALNTTASTSLGASAAGLASGVYNTARQVGQAVGIAVLGGLAASADARLGYVIAICLVTCCAAAVAVTALRSRGAEPPEVASELLGSPAVNAA